MSLRLNVPLIKCPLHKMSLRLDMCASPIIYVRIINGPVLTQKSADSNGIFIRFNGEIGLHPIFISNMTKIPLESSLF